MMNEIKLVGYALVFILCVNYWLRTIGKLLANPIDKVEATALFIAANCVTSVVYYFSPMVVAIKNSGNYDIVLVFIFITMAIALVATYFGFWVVIKSEKRYTTAIGHLLAAGPALVWAMVFLAGFRVAGNIHFEVFGTQKITNSSFAVSFAIALVYFVTEYAGNLRNLEAKTSEVVTFFGGKRTGQSLNEGINPLPGILPLFFQVGFYTLFRFSVFWGAVRGFITTPITFTGAIVAYTKDGKSAVLNISGIGKIIDATKVDDLIEDGADDPRGQLKRLFAEYLQQGVNAFIRTCYWQTLADGSGFGGLMVKSMAGSMKHLGLELKNVSVEWIGFQDQELQRVFQQIAGRDLRQMNQSMKADEIERMHRVGISREDAERVWEAFTKDGRGTFKFGI